MKRIAAAVLLLALAAPAQGQVVKDGQTYSTAAGTPIFYGSGGTYKNVTGTTPLPVTSLRFLASDTPIISDTCAVGMADSSAVIDVSNYREFGLIVKAIAPASNFVRLAIQVRVHIAGLADSNSTAPLMQHFTTAVAADSSSFGGVVGTSVVPSSDEVVLTIPTTNNVAAKWTAGNLRAIPLFTRDGPYAFIKYVSIRIRVLSAGANTPTITAYLRAGS